MKKSISNLGKTLNKQQQQKLNGGRVPECCLDWHPIERKCYRWDNNCF